jgi:hypothetical protein
MPRRLAKAASAGTRTVGKASALSSTEAPRCSSSMAMLDPLATALSVGVMRPASASRLGISPLVAAERAPRDRAP